MYDESEQLELIAQLKNNSEIGFRRLTELYGRNIYNTAYRFVGNREDARDVAQETLIQVCRSIGDFRCESDLMTWIYSIVRNNAYRHIDKRKRGSFSDMEKLIETHSDASQSVMSRAETAYYIEQVKEGCLIGLIRCLPFYRRAVFVLHILLEVSVQDTAKIVGKSEAAVRTLVTRARESISGFLCKNCSQYNPANRCRCEYLIGFSLSQGWIEPYRSGETPENLEKEILKLKSVVDLYRSIQDRELPEECIQSVRQILYSQTFRIFSSEK